MSSKFRTLFTFNKVSICADIKVWVFPNLFFKYRLLRGNFPNSESIPISQKKLAHLNTFSNNWPCRCREFKCMEVLNWSQTVVQSTGLPLKTRKSNFGSLELNCKSTVFGFTAAPILLRELLLPWLALTLSKLRLKTNSQVRLTQLRLTHKSQSRSPEHHFQYHLPQVVRKFPRSFYITVRRH